MIRHFPCGTDPLKSCGYDRLPVEPAEGEKIDIRCISGMGEKPPVLRIHAGGNISELTGAADFGTADNCYLFSVGPFIAGTKVSYSFTSSDGDTSMASVANSVSHSHDACEIYSFTVRRRVHLDRCIGLSSNGSRVMVECLLDDGSRFCFCIESNEMGISIAAFRGSDAEQEADIGKYVKISTANNCILSVEAEPFSIKLTDKSGNVLLQYDRKDCPASFDIDEKGVISRFSFALKASGKGFYGFGERFNSVNQRGRYVKNVTYDHFTCQGEYTYLPMPWMLTERGYGILIDTTCQTDFLITDGNDADAADCDAAEADGETGAVDAGTRSESCGISRVLVNADVGSDGLPVIYILLGTPGRLLGSLHILTGRCALPPKWAFGPWMSANGWDCQRKVEEQLRQMREHDIPATVLVLEAWSDETTFYIFNGAKYSPRPGGRYTLKDFIFDKNGPWPDPVKMSSELADAGLRLVLWQIPIIKNAADNDCEQLNIDEREAIDNKYCVFNADGTPYRIPDRWFCGSLLLDCTNPKAVEWWLEKRRYLCDELNVAGFKTDGGEFVFDRGVRFFNGKTGVEMRNAYPAVYTQTYYDFLKENGRNGVLFSRADYMGSQSRPLHWAGDQMSTFDEMKAQIKAGLSAGLSGIPFWGFDLGGFAGDLPCTELYLRATAMAAFSPIMQFHSEPLSGQFGDARRRSFVNDRTPWNMAKVNSDSSILEVYRKYARLRMKLLAYIYEEAIHCTQTGRPMMCHLVYDFPDDSNVIDLEDEYMFGRSLLIAPVTEEGASSRKVYLPEGIWLDFWTGKEYEGGRTLDVKCPLDHIPVFSVKEHGILYRDIL